MNVRLLYAGFLIALLLAASCQREEQVPPSCSVARPLEELSWLKAIVADSTSGTETLEIYRATYRNRTIYQVRFTLGIDGGVTTLYDCRGAELCKGYTTIGGFKTDCQAVFDATRLEERLYKR